MEMPIPAMSRWFSMEIYTRPVAMGLRGGRQTTHMVISTLDASAAQLAIELFHGELPQPDRTKVLVTPTWTDNQRLAQR